MQIVDRKKEEAIVPLFRLGFRSFFWFGSLIGILAVVLWVTSILGYITFMPFAGGMWWHAHEMIFGFAVAIIIGFVFTAVQNWTNIPGLRSWPLAALFSWWFIARLLLAFPVVPELAIIVIDVSFLPIAAVLLAKPLIAARQYRNMFFIPLFLLLTFANGLSYWSLKGNAVTMQHGFQVAVLAIVGLIAVMGGRVIPFFTARGTNTEKAQPIKYLEWTCLGATWLIVLLWALIPFTENSNLFNVKTILPYVAILTAMLHMTRCLRWHTKTLWLNPLIWSLHIGYYFLPLGYAVLALVELNLINWSVSSVIHIFTVGTIGGVILAMICRVSLGHTGRALQLPRFMSLGLAALMLSAICRTFLIDVLGYSVSLELSALLWALAFGLFLIVYFPILFKPRVDGRPG